tara:strand:+ start:551 stop:1042 length:492 start_codon:yes stop_codon:yes gene_type:complete
MIIKLKNKDTLICDDFRFKCSIGKKGLKKNKLEGDYSTPTGTFSLGPVYYRNDRLDKPNTKLKTIKINKQMGWCDDPNNAYYNKEIKLNKKIKAEKLYRKDKIYDIIIVINYNTRRIIRNKGSAIFIHVTNNYKPTKGCLALSLNDIEILLKIIKKNSKIKIS